MLIMGRFCVDLDCRPVQVVAFTGAIAAKDENFLLDQLSCSQTRYDLNVLQSDLDRLPTTKAQLFFINDCLHC
jgi:hypothetical protein